jgi:hypothetical protein
VMVLSLSVGGEGGGGGHGREGDRITSDPGQAADVAHRPGARLVREQHIRRSGGGEMPAVDDASQVRTPSIYFL